MLFKQFHIILMIGKASASLFISSQIMKNPLITNLLLTSQRKKRLPIIGRYFVRSRISLVTGNPLFAIAQNPLNVEQSNDGLISCLVGRGSESQAQSAGNFRKWTSTMNSTQSIYFQRLPSNSLARQSVHAHFSWRKSKDVSHPLKDGGGCCCCVYFVQLR